MITKETRTVVDVYHTYKLPFKEFWDIVKDSDVISKSVYYNPTYNKVAGHDDIITVGISANAFLNYLKTVDIRGEVYLISDKGDHMEISSQERTKDGKA